MSEKETVLAATGGTQLPAHLQDQPIVGMEKVGKNVITPRLTITQSSSKAPLTSVHPVQSVSFSSTEIRIANSLLDSEIKDGERASEPFTVVPVYHYITYEKRSDYYDDSQVMILESTQDRNTPLARRCLDFNLREEPYVIGTRKYTYQYLVCLNYFLEIQDGEAAGEVCIYTYHKGNFKTGKQFNTFLKRRNRSIYDNRVDLFAMHRMNKKGDFWLTLGFSDPRDEGGIYVQSPDDTKRLQELNQIFKGGMETGDIQVVPEEPLQ